MDVYGAISSYMFSGEGSDNYKSNNIIHYNFSDFNTQFVVTEQLLKKNKMVLSSWCMLLIPALRRMRQEDHEFKASLGCI